MIVRISRRSILLSIGLQSAVSAGPAISKATTAEEWMEEARATKGLASPLVVSRFRDPMYIVLQPGVLWTPNPDNGPNFGSVKVPVGFVTDLASIPPPLFPVLRADGDYAQAAIVHDYLYWTQRTTRKYADDVFRIAMRDLEVSKGELETLYGTVRSLGQSAWEKNAALKTGGERRFLKVFPKNASTRWADWKKSPDNFFENDL